MIHVELWQANLELARACLHHPFVSGLADGSLDREAYKRYVAQDVFFLKAFLRAYALAAARSRDLDEAQTFHALMGGGFEELKAHDRVAARFGIDLEQVRPYPETLAYTRFLMRTAWHDDVPQIVAAMTPCMRLYAYLGQELKKMANADTPYNDWIETYSGVEFQELAESIEQLLDRVATDAPAVRDAYRYAMECELRFFSAPLEVGDE